MGTTPSYGWVFPDPTDLVKDLPADFELFADAVDADLADLLGGTTGQLLSKASNSDHDFTWIEPAGQTQIATGTLSGASVAITSIPGTYKNLNLVVRGFDPATDNANLEMRFNNDSNTRYHFSSIASATVSNQSFGQTRFIISTAQDNAVNQGLSYTTIYDYANTTTWKMLWSQYVSNNSTTATNLNFDITPGVYNQTGAITELNIFASSGNLSGGTYFLFGES